MRRNNIIAALAYAIPMLYNLTALSENLSMLPALLMVCSGLLFALAFRKEELIKYHGLQSVLFNAVPMLLIFAVSKIFMAAGLLNDSNGLSIYMVIYSTMMLIVFFMPIYGIINAIKKKEGNIPLLTGAIKSIANKL